MPQFLSRHCFGGLLDLGIFCKSGYVRPERESALLIAHRNRQRAVRRHQPRGRDFRGCLAIERFRRVPAHQRGIGRFAEMGLRPARHTIDMLALRSGQLSEDRCEIMLVLNLHIIGKPGVSIRRFPFHRIGKREQFAQGLKRSCGLGLQERRSQQWHDPPAWFLDMIQLDG